MPTALVTGAGALGRGICESLVAKGWHVVTADVVADYAAELARDLGGPPVATAKTLDVGDFGAVSKLVGEIAAERGGIDALVNGAGGTTALKVRKGPLVDSLPEHWNRLIDVNLFGNFNCCYAVAPMMKKAGGGAIVSIASGAGMQSGPPISRQSGAAVYSATKAGVIAFVQALAQELGPYGIRVNAVSPGRNESREKPLAKMLELQEQEEKRDPGSGRLSPLGRFGRPADIGNAVAFLLSEEASYFTGTCLDLTGGIRLH
ncbi:MAG TPA: SDR family oxidoreductase [Alphaproteobacteria bacterium]|nr:SDR family oxidoreductase [Alphaproteobacteria bacterium]